MQKIDLYAVNCSSLQMLYLYNIYTYIVCSDGGYSNIYLYCYSHHHYVFLQLRNFIERLADGTPYLLSRTITWVIRAI